MVWYITRKGQPSKWAGPTFLAPLVDVGFIPNSDHACYAKERSRCANNGSQGDTTELTLACRKADLRSVSVRLATLSAGLLTR